MKNPRYAETNHHEQATVTSDQSDNADNTKNDITSESAYIVPNPAAVFDCVLPEATFLNTWVIHEHDAPDGTWKVELFDEVDSNIATLLAGDIVPVYTNRSSAIGGAYRHQSFYTTENTLGDMTSHWVKRYEIHLEPISSDPVTIGLIGAYNAKSFVSAEVSGDKMVKGSRISIKEESAFGGGVSPVDSVVERMISLDLDNLSPADCESIESLYDELNHTFPFFLNLTPGIPPQDPWRGAGIKRFTGPFKPTLNGGTLDTEYEHYRISPVNIARWL